MSIHMFNTWGRKMGLLGCLALGLTQVGCAHPVMVEPSVAISSHIGYPSVYAQVQVPGPMVVMPSPRAIYMPPPPPRVVYAQPMYAPQIYRSAPVWGYGGRHESRDWRYRQGHGHGGDRDGWHH